MLIQVGLIQGTPCWGEERAGIKCHAAQSGEFGRQESRHLSSISLKLGVCVPGRWW